MSEAKSGDTVKVHYTGKLEDGSEFDSSRGRDPLEFTLGEGQIIPGFENAVVGMNEGDTKTVVIPPENAYGKRHEEAVQQVPKTMIPEELRAQLQVGMQLQARDPNDQPMMLTVMEIDDETVTMDANHPLAGKDLTFDLELVKVG